jgi:hypothetical protein
MVKKYQLAKFEAAAYSHNPNKYQTDVWKLVSDSDQLHKSDWGYFGAVYINEQSKEIIIANSGTNFDFLSPIDLFKDLLSDYQIARGQVPKQFTNAAKEFVNLTLSSLVQKGIDLSDFKIVSTGHSLGAVLSDLVAIELASQGYQTESITFDSLGSYSVIKNYLTELNNNKLLSYTALQDVHLEVYNAAPHYLNTYDQHLGEVYQVEWPHQLNSLSWAPEVIQSHYFKNWYLNAFDKDSGDLNNITWKQTNPIDLLIKEVTEHTYTEDTILQDDDIFMANISSTKLVTPIHEDG